MTLDKRNAPIILFLIACFIAYMRASITPPVCEGDCFGYIALMGKSPFSADYYAPLKMFYRSLSIPVIYSLFGSYTPDTAKAIVLFQAFALFAAWVAFAFSLSGLFHGRIRIGVFAVTTLGMFGRGYYHLDSYLLSDALSLALLLLWYAPLMALPWLIAFPRTHAVCLRLCIVLAFLVAGSRDTNAFLLPFGVLHLFLFRQRRRECATLSICFLLAAGVPFFHGVARHDTNITNIMGGVIFPDP